MTADAEAPRPCCAESHEHDPVTGACMECECWGTGMLRVNPPAPRPAGEREIEELRRDLDAVERALISVEGLRERAESAEAALAEARRERDEIGDALLSVLEERPSSNGEWVHLVICSGDRRKPPGTSGCVCLRALAQARAALESTREALFSYRSLAYGYAPMKTLEEYDDKHERALLPPPGEKP
jgi:hypothetical protein